jgi:hypothetical protein
VLVGARVLVGVAVGGLVGFAGAEVGAEVGLDGAAVGSAGTEVGTLVGASGSGVGGQGITPPAASRQTGSSVGAVWAWAGEMKMAAMNSVSKNGIKNWMCFMVFSLIRNKSFDAPILPHPPALRSRVNPTF